jgi:tight adherence protein B
MDMTLAMYGVGALVLLNFVAVIAQRMKKPVTADGGELTVTTGQIDRFAFLQRFLKGRRGASKIERDLITAGLLLKPTEFLMINLVVLIVFFLIGGIYAGSMTLGHTDAATEQFVPDSAFVQTIKRSIAIGVFTLLGFHLPRMVLNMMANKRRTKLEYQLVDALAIISSGLKGGYSFAQGLDMAATQMEAPIKDEFARVMRLIQLGLPTDRALQQMAERINSYDYDMTVGATNIQLSVGGNLSQLLEGIAATIRDRIRLRRDISALTAQGRISGGILIALPLGIAAMLRIINPEYMAYLTDTALGNSFLYFAAGQQAVGIYWIKKLLDFDN